MLYFKIFYIQNFKSVIIDINYQIVNALVYQFIISESSKIQEYVRSLIILS